jgi:predicted GIY-YIG superfamily endonuclease
MLQFHFQYVIIILRERRGNMQIMQQRLLGKENKTVNVFSNSKLPKKSDKGEYVYVINIHYPDKSVFKIGTTNNVERRLYEHLGSYKEDITVCWISPHYSKYTTHRVEDKNKDRYKKNIDLGYIRNDRFSYPVEVVNEIIVKVKKEYKIPLIRYGGS